MKKIILVATIIMISTFVGVAQNAEKVLKMGKWYASDELGSKTITLTKSTTAKLPFDIELINDAAISYGQIAKADFVSNEGGMIKAGTYYTNNTYGYKVNGNTIVITYQPTSWTYNVKTLPNGDVVLELVTPTTKSTK